MKIVLRKTGIDTSQFKPAHVEQQLQSYYPISISLEGVLKRGQWSGESTLEKHYHKPIQSNKNFEKAILSSGKAL